LGGHLRSEPQQAATILPVGKGKRRRTRRRRRRRRRRKEMVFRISVHKS
jgi:hypothetical protein